METIKGTGQSDPVSLSGSNVEGEDGVLMKIVIPGGSGQVGTALARSFIASGDEVVILSRKQYSADWRVVEWDAKTLGSWAGHAVSSDVRRLTHSAGHPRVSLNRHLLSADREPLGAAVREQCVVSTRRERS